MSAMTRNPISMGMGMTTGTKAPITHVSWKRVSNLAKDRPRLASGASRCPTEPNPTLPHPAASPPPPPGTPAPPRPPGGRPPPRARDPPRHKPAGPGGQHRADRGQRQDDLEDALLRQVVA